VSCAQPRSGSRTLLPNAPLATPSRVPAIPATLPFRARPFDEAPARPRLAAGPEVNSNGCEGHSSAAVPLTIGCPACWRWHVGLLS
jgi:hypothetical protein